jgi:hypothetical protein
MMVSGAITKGMEEVLMEMNTVIFTMVSGFTVKWMERVPLPLLSKSHTKAFGF